MARMNGFSEWLGEVVSQKRCQVIPPLGLDLSSYTACLQERGVSQGESPWLCLALMVS